MRSFFPSFVPTCSSSTSSPICFGSFISPFSNQALTAEYSRPEVRGAVAGMFSLWGGLGILISSSLGGFLFDIWNERAPFVLLGGLNVVTCVLSIAVYIYFRRHPERLQHYTRGSGNLADECSKDSGQLTELGEMLSGRRDASGQVLSSSE